MSLGLRKAGWLLVMGLPLGCTAKTDTACVPGDSKACACTTGATGAQRCLDDGSKYDVCVCTGSSSSSSSSTGGSSGGASSSAGASSSSSSSSSGSSSGSSSSSGGSSQASSMAGASSAAPPSSGSTPSSSSAGGGSSGAATSGAGNSSSADTSSSAAVSSSSSGPPPSLCGTVPSDFACTAFDPGLLKPGSTTCDDAGIHQFVADCYDSSTATAETCAAWMVDGVQGMTPCGQCINLWVAPDGYPDTFACRLLYAGGADPAQQQACRDAMTCYRDCGNTACNAAVCDDTARDSQGQTELDRCYSLPGVFSDAGTCGAMPAGGTPAGPVSASCQGDAIFLEMTANCRLTSTNPSTVSRQIEYFFRGACRDNAVWTGANTPP